MTALRGYDYFILLSEESENRTESYTTPGTFQATTTHTGYTSTTTGQVTPGETTSVRKYGGVAMIKMFKGDKPADHPAAYNAEELMGFLQQQYSDLKPAPPSN